MRTGGNADGKQGEIRMEKEDSARTVECLRGRLIAERAASRSAKEKAEQLGNKLMELENLVKQETKSRTKAEKKLKALMKKLESKNIPYASDESQHSMLMDKTDISSISSITSSSIKEQHNEDQNTENSKSFEAQEPEENVISQKEWKMLQQNDLQKYLFSLSDDSSTVEGTSISAFVVDSSNASIEDSLSSAGDEHSEKSSSKMDHQQSDISNHSTKSYASERLNKDDQDSDSTIDNSMALVLVDSPEKRPIDPVVLDATVKEVLDVLRHAKEQLRSSMEKRRMNAIRVG